MDIVLIAEGADIERTHTGPTTHIQPGKVELRPRFQTLVHQAKAPVVLPSKVSSKGKRYFGTYYDWENDIIYWAGPLKSKWDRRDFYHELGHVFDAKVLTDEQRIALTKYFKAPRRWFWEDWNPMTHQGKDPVMEVFADAYSDCCMYWYKQRKLRKFLNNVYRSLPNR